MSSPSQPWRPGAIGSLRLWLLLVILAAALLRFWGLAQGIPFALGVDEPEVMERALRMMRTGDFNPHFYDYPALYIYLQAALATVRFVWGAIHAEWAALSQAATSEFYLWGRALTATIGTASVWLLYRAGLRWDPRTAIVAAVLLAVMPLHVRESHYVLTDVPTTFLVVLTLVQTLRAREQGTRLSFVLAGVAAGLSAATKYNGGLALLMPLMAAAVLSPREGSRWGRLGLVLAGCLGAFLAGAPYTLLDLPTFLNEFARLANQYRTTPVGPTPIPIIYLKHLRLALGWSGSVIVAAGFLLAAWRIVRGPDRFRWSLIVTFPLVYFWFVSGQRIVYARYLLPLVPFLALIAAALIVEVVDWIRDRSWPAHVAPIAAAALAILAVAPPAWTSYRYDLDAGRTWTTHEAYRWIRQNIPAGASIVIETRALVFSDGYKVTNVPQLQLRTVDDYRAEGVQYLVAVSERFGAVMAAPAAHPQEYTDYVRIFAGTQELQRFLPSTQHPGPEVRILKIPPAPTKTADTPR